MVHVQFKGHEYVIKNFNDLKSLEQIISPPEVSPPVIDPPTSSNNAVDHAMSLSYVEKTHQTPNNEHFNTSFTNTVQYKLNYPTLYSSLLKNYKSSQPLRGYPMRGMPSRNGRATWYVG